MDYIRLDSNEEDKFIIKEEKIENFGIVGENVYEKASNNWDQHEFLGTNVVKAENIDILDQFIDENGIHDFGEYEIKSEIVIPSEPSYDAHHQEAKDMCKKQVIGTREIGFDYSEENSLKQELHNNNLCDKVIKNEGDFKQHVDSKDWNSKQIKCGWSDLRTNRRVSPQDHQGSDHLNPRKHECVLCDFTANRLNHLKRHINTVHLNIRQHVCHLCEYAANDKAKLKRHIDAVHLNLKQYKCEICGYATHHKSNLKKHTDSVHLNLKQHECELCDYATNRKCDLKHHIDSVHLNLKNHECHLCEAKFNHKSTLNRHLDSVHSKSKQCKQ